jgi:hypothetical protein
MDFLMPDWLVTVGIVLVSNAIGAGVVYGAMRERLKNVEREVGTRDTGLRHAVHEHRNDLLKLDGRVRILEMRNDSR